MEPVIASDSVEQIPNHSSKPTYVYQDVGYLLKPKYFQSCWHSRYFACANLTLPSSQCATLHLSSLFLHLLFLTRSSDYAMSQMSKNGGNTLGLAEEDGLLVTVNQAASWTL